MIIEFTADKPQNWLQHITEQFGVELEDNTINLPPHIGEGFLRHYYLTNGITLNYLRFKFFQKITFYRKAGKEVPFSPIIFYIHENKFNQYIEDEKKEIFLNSPNGVFWPSSHISSVWEFPINEWFLNITVSINHEWLLKTCKRERNNYVDQLIDSDKPFYIFEEITPQMYRLIKEITDIIEMDSHNIVSYLSLEAKTIGLLAIFFEKVIEQPLTRNISNISKQDIKKIFKVKDYILNNISETPCLEKLADMTNLSRSKLHRCFKQVFGKSICTYALHEKLHVAKQMLESQQYNVSEVGYELGYSNLSHFSEAFRKHHGMNPKAFLRPLTKK